MREVFELQGMTQMVEEEKVFLRSGEELIRVIIPAAGAPRNQESLEPLLHDIPLAMLDINGKSILQRNVETPDELMECFVNTEKFRIPKRKGLPVSGRACYRPVPENLKHFDCKIP